MVSGVVVSTFISCGSTTTREMTTSSINQQQERGKGSVWTTWFDIPWFLSTKLWRARSRLTEPQLAQSSDFALLRRSHSTLSSVFGTIVRLQHTLVSRVRFVMDTHLRRLLGRHNCTVVLLLEPGSNTLGKCVFLANMRQRLPSTNSVHGGHKPMLKHSNCVWTQALQVKHKSETLEPCLNTSTRLKQKSEPLKVCLDTVRLLNPPDHPALQRHSTVSFCL